MGMTFDIWNERFWLPDNWQWEHLNPNGFDYYYDLIVYPIPVAIFITLLKLVTQRYCFTPIGIAAGIPIKGRNKPKKNDILEVAYKSNHRWTCEMINILKGKTDMTERQIRIWFRARRQKDRPTKLVKFAETGWRFLYFLSSLIFGLSVLWDKPWLWNMDHCWIDYPRHVVTNGVWWYYTLSLGLYLSLMISQFFDVKRKDFWHMFIHHIATIVLLSISSICNLRRIGTLILFMHDTADCCLEAAKLSKYLKLKWTTVFTFVLFSIIWISTRVVIYPFWIFKSTVLDAPRIVNMMSPIYYICNGLLGLLLILNIYWTFLVLQAIYSAFFGKIGYDARSSDESDDEDKTKNE